ncbi:uncharacterized protein LOC129738161 [Uranotaenia lowii]|uniref:uncharacterized protein LOC129738161 n=1 Tax=Uranotaenia lowii TaxID=190385 RepID=UPI00247AEF18|nr:uncharacterized protein LOC129738161 [Uranotaenia lowii]
MSDPANDTIRNVEKSVNNRNCMYCEEVDSEDDMVQCDMCSFWSHYQCAGVTEAVKSVPWNCTKCSNLLHVPKIRKPVKKNVSKRTGSAKSDVGTELREGRPSIQESLSLLEQESAAIEQQLQEEKILHDKRLELERSVNEKRRALQQKMQEEKLRQEKLQLEQQLADHKDFLIRQKQMRDQFRKMKADLSQEFENDEEDSDPDVGSVKTKAWVETQEDPRGAYPKKPAAAPRSFPLTVRNALVERHGETDSEQSGIGRQRKHEPLATSSKGEAQAEKKKSVDTDHRFKELLEHYLKANGSQQEPEAPEPEESELEKLEQALIRKLLERNTLGRACSVSSGPTKEQLAARQAASKHLPTFRGEPEVWPQFISCFEYTTEACGYTNTDNLKRLQDSLQGLAKEAVQSRLLMPESVPEVIEDLRQLFGNPEKLLKSLMAKVRKVQAPRVDKLESFLYFGITVKQLCDHLVAAKLHDHLSNPMLVAELVDKLPSDYQLDWVRFKRGRTDLPLRMFADFMKGIVSEVSEVADFNGEQNTAVAEGRRMYKRKERVNTHDTKVFPVVQNTMPARTRKPCPMCNRTDHKLRFCDDFSSMSLPDRQRLVDRLKLCNICLCDHGKMKCTFKVRCEIRSCKGNHHTLLHRHEEAVNVTVAECNPHYNVDRSVIFRMIPITLHHGGKAVQTLAFLDEGASTTLVESSLAESLGVEGTPEPLVIVWTGNVKRNEDSSRKIDLLVSAVDSRRKFMMSSAHTVGELKLPLHKACYRSIVDKYHHLDGVPLSSTKMEVPRVLIGLDNLHLFAPLESKVGAPGEPIAVRSALGWAIYGPDSRLEQQQHHYLNHHLVQSLNNRQLHDLMAEQYAQEELHVAQGNPIESEEIQRARETLESTTVRVGDRFETGLLWKQEPVFPDSYPMALNRLKSLERRFQREPHMKQNVNQQIEYYLAKGYCHKATAEELKNTNPSSVWYLPLNVVLNPKKPHKVRLVWDAAAKSQGVSLNSYLLKGPDLLASLPAVISKFRERRVAVGGDIKEMYHQLRIREADKQAQRFLFRFPEDDHPTVFVMDVATFGAASSPCSAQYVKNLNAQQFSTRYPAAAQAIVYRHYVDDYYDSFDTEEEAIERTREVRWIHSKGGFEITNWTSNSTAVLRSLGVGGGSRESIHLNQDKVTDYERVLGIMWDTQNDVFSFAVPTNAAATEAEPPKKRGVLSTVMSLFDPIGLLAPFTVLGKMLMQDLWRAGCDWDQRIDGECLDKWRQWIAMFSLVEGVRIPRCNFGSTPSDRFGQIQLHIFSDAGENAYGSVAYLRICVENTVKCSLVMARSKVAPIKLLSIPRLELKAAVLGAHLSHTVKKNHSLPIHQIFYWSDSRTVLSWIQSDQRHYQPFVGFRIGEILSLSKLTDWRYVPTKLNVADSLTKWGRLPDLSSEGSWFRGPEFLYQQPSEWPQQNLPAANTRTEIKAIHLFHGVELPSCFIDVTRFSKWNVAVRTVACIFRFISNCRRKATGKSIEAVLSTPKLKKLIKVEIPFEVVPLRQDEHRCAENALFRLAQSESYSDEIKILKKNAELPFQNWFPLDKSSPLYKLVPLIDADGVLRMEGRSEKAEFLPFDLRFPIILPRSHYVTGLLIQQYHERFGHGFRETVKNEIKQRFLISGLTNLIRRTERSCVWCKVRKCLPKNPRMAALPVQRLTPFKRPFNFVGIDYLGPVEVVVGRRREKRWVAVFTCMVVRAVHLEVVHSLTAQSCIMAIRRFISRRGPASEYFTDNGTNFRGASKEIIQRVREIDAVCADEFTTAITSWHFIPPGTPHMGGAWERMVRSVKQVMAALDDGRRLNDEILLTTLAETEDMINSRPLTFVTTDPVMGALCPNVFLRGSDPNEPHEVIKPTHPAEALRDAYKRSQQLSDELWKRWIREYVPTINQRSKWFSETNPLKKGDLVYVVEGSRRKAWVRGIIEEPIVSGDGRVRQALVRTAGGVFRRGTANLAVLEIADRVQTVGPESAAHQANSDTGGNADPVAPESESGPGLRVGDC